jgi:hypothetical protein
MRGHCDQLTRRIQTQHPSAHLARFDDLRDGRRRRAPPRAVADAAEDWAARLLTRRARNSLGTATQCTRGKERRTSVARHAQARHARVPALLIEGDHGVLRQQPPPALLLGGVLGWGRLTSAPRDGCTVGPSVCQLSGACVSVERGVRVS